jgi:proposed homoserine kinase
MYKAQPFFGNPSFFLRTSLDLLTFCCNNLILFLGEKMKYVIILGDGMADYPIENIGGTPLSVAKIENINRLAKTSMIGLVKTVPDGFAAGSDTANLSVLGYDPRVCYSGRSPLEALSIGIDMAADDISFRCNLVTLSEDEPFENKTMVDYSAGEIGSDDAAVLIRAIDKEFGSAIMKFYAGVSYRHCLIMKGGKVDDGLTPPHDISGRKITNYLPSGVYAEKFRDLYKRANAFLSKHPINLERIKNGKNPANCIWLWGAGTKPKLSPFAEKYGKTGAMISAVDLLKGIGKAADMKIINVEGATGNYDTNYKNKGLACLEALKTCDFCYVHIEAPDECGHRGEIGNKIYSIEHIDTEIVKTVVDGLTERNEDFCLLLLPDHPTPIAVKSHTKDEVPFLIYSTKRRFDGAPAYNEAEAKATGIYIEFAPDLMEFFTSL